jgi:hypothetical protein
MMAWLGVLLISALVGLICAMLHQGRIGMILSVATPWFGLLAWLFYRAGPDPHEMLWNWIAITQTLIGTSGALASFTAFHFSKGWFRRHPSKSSTD